MPAVASSRTGLTTPSSAVRVNSNVRQQEQRRWCASTSPCGYRRTDTRSGWFLSASSACTTVRAGSAPLPVIAARLRPGRSGNAAALLNLWPLSQPALRRRGTEVTCPKRWACTSACCLTLRSAPTHYGRPACPCGALVYAAPHGQAVLPPRSVLAQTLGSTNTSLAYFTSASESLHAPRSNSLLQELS